MVNLTANKGLEETSREDSDYIIQQGISLSYQQAFTQKITGNLGITQTTEDFKGDNANERQTSSLNSIINVEYAFRDWLNGSIGYTGLNTTSDSSVENTEFERNEYMFRIAVAF